MSTFLQIHEGGFYFRILGYGLTVMRAADHPALFSERQGYRQFLYIGPYKVGVLRP